MTVFVAVFSIVVFVVGICVILTSASLFIVTNRRIG
jgi:hypothetical protein